MITKNSKIKKEFRQNVFFSALLGLFIFGIVSTLIVSNWKINKKRTEYNTQLEILQEQLQQLENQKAGLQEQILQTSEEEYLEEQARENFNLKKPGEEVVVVLPPEEEEIKAPEKEFWKNIWDKIKFW